MTNIYLYADNDNCVEVSDIHELKESEVDIDKILKSIGIKIEEGDEDDDKEKSSRKKSEEAESGK